MVARGSSAAPNPLCSQSVERLAVLVPPQITDIGNWVEGFSASCDPLCSKSVERLPLLVPPQITNIGNWVEGFSASCNPLCSKSVEGFAVLVPPQITDIGNWGEGIFGFPESPMFEIGGEITPSGSSADYGHRGLGGGIFGFP